MAKRNRQPFTMRAEWKEGPTNPAWEELWRRIFAGRRFSNVFFGDASDPAAIRRRIRPFRERRQRRAE